VLRSFLTALVGAGLAFSPVPASTPSPASAPSPGSSPAPASNTATCLGWHTVTGADSRQYTVSPDNWGGGATCLTAFGGQAGFVVAAQPAPGDGHVLAFPDAAIGCTWGTDAYCTTGWQPEPVATANPSESAAMGDLGAATDTWDFASDLWFWPDGAAHPDAEMMIYLDEQNLPVPKNAVQVLVAGVPYWYKTYTMSNGSYSWRYVVFEHLTPSRQVTALRLAPFFAYAEGQNVLSGSDELQQVSTGFEVSSGGAGLRLVRFSLAP
jgi:hypothetical protein